MAILPAEIPTGIVTGQFYFVSEDNVDADTNPELTVVSGDVIFTCTAKKLRMPTKLATVIPLEFKAKFNGQGELVSDADDTLGIQLPATDSPLFNPTDFTWKVEFDIVQVENRHTVNIEPFEFQVPEGEIVDLTLVMPVDSSPGVLTVQGPQGIQGVIGPEGPPVSLSVGETITGPSTPGTPGPQGVKGDKGDPGGIVAATTITDGTDLNSFVDAGTYRFLSTGSTTALNYPKTGLGGILLVLRNSSTIVTQTVFPLSTTQYKGIWQRSLVTTWGAWHFIASQRVDQTAGRAIYTWDDLNNRDQLVYGDTGDRDIIASHGNGTFAALKLRRYGALVDLTCVGWVPPTNGAGMFTTQLPVGFRSVHTRSFAALDGSTLRPASMSSASANITVTGSTTGSNIGLTLTYATTDNWPTTLPGTASGSIPNL